MPPKVIEAKQDCHSDNRDPQKALETPHHEVPLRLFLFPTETSGGSRQVMTHLASLLKRKVAEYAGMPGPTCKQKIVGVFFQNLAIELQTAVWTLTQYSVQSGT